MEKENFSEEKNWIFPIHAPRYELWKSNQFKCTENLEANCFPSVFETMAIIHHGYRHETSWKPFNIPECHWKYRIRTIWMRMASWVIHRHVCVLRLSLSEFDDVRVGYMTRDLLERKKQVINWTKAKQQRSVFVHFRKINCQNMADKYEKYN